MSEPRTNQEVFDYVLQKLYEQGRPARLGDSGHGACVFRTDDGRRCAAGWLIPDDLLTEENLGADFSTIAESEAGRDPRLLRLNRSLVSAMQGAHDCAPPDDGWLRSFCERMRDIAAAHGLQYHDPTGTPPRGEP